MVHYTKDPARLNKALISWIIASIIIAAATIYNNHMLIGNAAAPTGRAIGALLMLLDFIVELTASIIFLRWVYIAAMNCRGFGARGMSYNPGQAVGTYFLPLYCMFKPYYSFKEIWQCSQNPLHWKGMKSSPAIIIWWVLWLVSSFYSDTDQCTLNAANPSSVLVSSMYTKSIHIIMCLLAIYLVTTLRKMQEAWVRQNAEDAKQTDESP